MAQNILSNINISTLYRIDVNFKIKEKLVQFSLSFLEILIPSLVELLIYNFWKTKH